ncbi:hypothetical protein [Stenotrophomonas sp.]|uniref:hypothetical protein n=1 Tax=Stenotrophomonas sp. TaxID=69392 RepID=UPI00289C7A85|nr:hypothetical protein [Stenotrophomonas sp.]
MNPQLFPRQPRRMRQPAKEVLRDQLATAADEVIRLRAENQRLRDAAHSTAEQLRAALAIAEGGQHGSIQPEDRH